MKNTKTITAAFVLAVMAVAGPASAALVVEGRPDGVTVTNTGDTVETFRVQLGDAEMSVELEPGESDTRIADAPSAISWAVWDTAGELLGSGEITDRPANPGGALPDEVVAAELGLPVVAPTHVDPVLIDPIVIVIDDTGMIRTGTTEAEARSGVVREDGAVRKGRTGTAGPVADVVFLADGSVLVGGRAAR